MADMIVREEEEQKQSRMESTEGLGRKEKRKVLKKQKRKQMRKEMAVKERAEEEARWNDPEEQLKMKLKEEEEAERIERERKEFEERERRWIEAAKRRAEEEERRKVVEESERNQVEHENEINEGDDWEYVEEGPAEIIWQGNEIIVKKKRVRVAKKDLDQQSKKEDADRPTSNPLPPQSEAFADYKNASMVSVQHAFENVAQQIPNFGTEQDKAHCPFHLKTGACRFGPRCSRVHFYPDKSCTLLIKNMYNGPGLAWEQDEGLEYMDEEVERCYEEFYEDVHTEFLKFGEIVNFKVCKNGSFHLRGNVYVHYKSLDSAVLAYQYVNGRYFAGKQVKCEFVGVTRWRVAICGEFMKSRLKTCSHGTACNFIHCFRNPGGDYEWADWDKPAPKYWVKKMAALFGFSDESGYDKQLERETLGRLRNSDKMITADADRYRSRRSRSREMDCLNSGSGRSHYDESDVRKSTHWQRPASDGRKRMKILNEEKCRTHDTDSDGDWSDRDGDREKHHDHTRKSSRHRNKLLEFPNDHGDSKIRTQETDFYGDLSDGDRDRDRHRDRTRKSSRHRNKLPELLDDHEDGKNRTREIDSYGDWSDRDRDRERHDGRARKSSRHRNKASRLLDDHGDTTNKTHDTDSNGDRSDKDIERDRDRHHSHRRKSSRHRNQVLVFPDDHGDSKNKTCDTDSNGDWVDRDRDRRRSGTKKRSRHLNEASEFSDDHGEPKKKLKDKFHCRESDPEKSEL